MLDGDPGVKRLEGEISYLKDAVIPALRRENIKVSAHCAALIQAMLDHGISHETIKKIAIDQQSMEPK